MKAAFLALAIFVLASSQAFALSAEFVGQKQVTICSCDSAVIPIAINNDGKTDAAVSFETRGSTGLVTVPESNSFSSPAGSRQIRNIFIASSCDAREGYASIAAKFIDTVSGEQAPEAGVIKVVQCSKLALRLDKSSFACGESEYDFTLTNAGLEAEKGSFETNLLGSEYSISEREFNVPAGKSAGVILRVKVDDASRGQTLVLTANGAKSSASATAELEKVYCANGGGSGNGGSNGNGGGNGGGSGGLFGPLSGFFTLGLTNFSFEWLLLLLALLLIAFFYYTVRQLESQEAELDRRALAR
jgi:hypothetical protein